MVHMYNEVSSDTQTQTIIQIIQTNHSKSSLKNISELIMIIQISSKLKISSKFLIQC
jgi:hypothetical protein